MKVLCAGEVLIDWVSPDRGARLTNAGTFHPSPGGAPANVAVGLARLGTSVAFAGKVAQDAWGQHLLDLLASEGVNLEGVVRDVEADTRMAYVILDETGERHLASFSRQAADARWRPEDADAVPLEDVAIVLLGSMMQAASPSREAFWRLLARAKDHGVLVAYDPNYRQVLWPDPDLARAALEEACQAADLIKLGAEELAFLSGTPDLRAGMRRLWECFSPALLVVTEGPLGSFWKNAAGEGHVQAFPVPVVDPTGAGDGFVAGLLAGIMEEGPARETVRWLPPETMAALLRRANGVGAQVATQVGAMTALPTRDALDAWLAECED